MEEKYISLKEAAEISGYAPDYIGQLIRSGKIVGKQVYTNVSWVTTEEAVLGYKNKSVQSDNKQEGIIAFIETQTRRIKLEIAVFRQLLKTFKSFLPVISVFVISFFVFILLLLNYLAGGSGQIGGERPAEKINNSITF